MFTIDARKIYHPEMFNREPRVSVDSGKFITLGDQNKARRHIRALEYDLVPGFIDLQINGAFGYDFTSQPDSIWRVAERLPEFGITTCLPTIITSPLEVMENALQVWMNTKPAGYHGTYLPGLHLEGPFLNPKKKGAHAEGFFQMADPRLVQNWTPQNGVRMVTIAPEIPGAINLIITLSQRGILMSAGHSLADAHQARTGFGAGIRYATHLFNAMTSIHHREPGLVMVVLEQEEVSFGMILDGLHVAPELVRLAWQYLGNRRLTLVTDASAALGMPAGTYQLGSNEIQVDGFSARLADGTLAGSALTPLKALQNLQSFTKCSFQEALACWTANPARVLGLRDRGVIRPGAVADFVLLSADQQVAATFVAGELLYQAPWANLQWV
ncbi:MAG: N-acetylglucosamine-6-phosphate deacetylase [Chloroflexi bacterium HGW-Chloroflexi-3]|nr:MAG: N-acetylglucosamine-6-phosphate deacetylase [Chloroflexi bacterium HGW-Chloroflexi-3]